MSPTGFCVPPNWTWPEREAAICRMARADVAWARATFCAAPSGDDPAATCLRLAQAAAYVPDPPSCPTDFYKLPRDTWREGGDCDDLVILLLCVAWARGVDAKAERIEIPHAPQDHLAAKVWCGARGWCWADPSMRGAAVGEHPAAAARRLGLDAVAPGLPKPTAGLGTELAIASVAPLARSNLPLTDLLAIAAFAAAILTGRYERGQDPVPGIVRHPHRLHHR
jgi:hypothetical protein